ncbi:MAG TPA: C25 family cysteine peptidase, partial [Myxococcales bacterium]
GEAEKFFGQAVTRQPTIVCVQAPNIDASAGQPAQLVVNLQGATQVDHRVFVSFNGVPQGEVVLSGQMAGGLNVPVSVSLLREAGNTVTLNSGGDTDVSLLSSVELTYPKKYRAEQGLAKFTVAGPAVLTIPGFLHSPRAIDVTDPALPRELPVQVIPNGTDLSARLSIGDSGRLTVLVFEPGQTLTPLSLKANPGSRWNQPDNRADLVMIATQDMLSALEPLKAQREMEGYQAALVDIEQIYNEFSFGQKDRRAVAAFFQLATSTWNKPPKFGLLAGSASYDPRNYLGLGNFDRVPTRLIQTSDLETFSDDFVLGVAFGRFPAKTPAELAVMVAKSIKHVPLGNGSPKRVALISDQNDSFNFEGESRRLGSLFASDVSTVEVFRGTLGNAAMPGEVQNQLNAGPWLALYYGHGSQGLWAGPALTAPAAEGLISQERLGVVVSLTCLNGYFADVYSTDLATALVKAPQGGAVAAWASSSLTTPEPQSAIGSEFIRQVTQGVTIGEAAMVAKAASTNDDVRSTWILFGDPTLRMAPVSTTQPTSHGCGCGATSGSPVLIAALWMVGRTLSLRRFRGRSKRA